MLKKIAAAAAALALTAAAHAGTVVFDGTAFNSGDVDTQQFFFTSPFDSPSASGVVTFTLEGFNTLDGQNYYEDDFTLTVNGVAVLVGTFDLGGAGANVLYTAPSGTVITGLITDPNTVTGNGGSLNFTVPVSLLAGGNVIYWNYDSLSDANHAGFQGIGDEGWGLAGIQVTAVPEAGSLAMMLAGLGIVGGLARRRAARQA